MNSPFTGSEIRHDWALSEVLDLFYLPMNDLLFRAQSVHRQNFDPNSIQVSTLLSIKTGSCPEDCKYCGQSGHYQSEVVKESLLKIEQVVAAAEQAKASGATRFCMGAAWRCPQNRHMPAVVEMVTRVKALGLETCMTLGMLTLNQAEELAAAGLDYYNHNLDTSEGYYPEIVSTRTYQDRLDTLNHVRNAGVKICSGGILGMGETREDRADLLRQLANLPVHPESVPINMLIPMPGTPLENQGKLDPLEFVRTVAAARIMMPRSHVRLSAGRESMSDEMQLLCYFAGADSIFSGKKLLTAPNKELAAEEDLFQRLGITFKEAEASHSSKAGSSLFYDAMKPGSARTA